MGLVGIPRHKCYQPNAKCLPIIFRVLRFVYQSEKRAHLRFNGYGTFEFGMERLNGIIKTLTCGMEVCFTTVWLLDFNAAVKCKELIKLLYLKMYDFIFVHRNSFTFYLHSLGAVLFLAVWF